MKKITVFLSAFILILSLNGNAAEIVPADLDLSPNSSYVGKIPPLSAETISEPESKPGMHFVPEPINMLILGVGFVVLGLFARKKISRR
jgi:hypothetical protein